MTPVCRLRTAALTTPEVVVCVCVRVCVRVRVSVLVPVCCICTVHACVYARTYVCVSLYVCQIVIRKYISRYYCNAKGLASADPVHMIDGLCIHART